MWPRLKAYVDTWVKKSPKYNVFKRTTNRPYGDIYFNYPEVLLWSTNDVDLVTPWKVLFNNIDDINTNKSAPTLTGVDSATFWPDKIYIKGKSSADIRRIFNDNWLHHYPRTSRVIHDGGTELTVW